MTDVDMHNDPCADYEGKQEPDCATCCDRGVLLDEADYAVVSPITSGSLLR